MIIFTPNTVIKSTEINSNLDELKTKTDYLSTPDTGWIAPSLQNSWANYGSGYATAGYIKDALGRVQLRGLLKNGTIVSGTLIFTLPTGYRPLLNLIFINKVTGSAYAETRINSDGTVKVGDTAWNATWTSIDNITYKAEA